MTFIHPSSIVEDPSKIGKDVHVGPFCHIGPNVYLQDRVKLMSHVTIDGDTVLGEDTVVYPFAALGYAPQDLKYQGEASRLRIGARNRIREYVTMHPGTEGGGLETTIGDDGLFMVGVHVAHDCRVGNQVVMANNATLAGHVVVEDCVVIGGLSAVHQFVRIGAHAMIGGMSGVEQDVIPYGLVIGDRARLAGLNLVGLKRRGFEAQTIQLLRDIYRSLFEPASEDHRPFTQRLEAVQGALAASEDVSPDIERFISFITGDSTRRLCLPR